MGKNKGEFKNPMDRLRKESRRRELNKNKKQRQVARTTLMKLKNPHDIIRDLEKLDRVEFDPYNEPALPEKILEVRRKKLSDSLGRLISFHKQEDPERYAEIKKIEATYRAKRDEIVKEYHAIKSTENVDLDAIPLPSEPLPPSKHFPTSSNFPSDHKWRINRKPPGCPQGFPPNPTEFDLSDIVDSEDEAEEKAAEAENLNEFLKEIEAIAGDKDEEPEEPDTEENPSLPVISSLPPIQAAPPILSNPPPFIPQQPRVPLLKPMPPGQAPLHHPFAPRPPRLPFQPRPPPTHFSEYRNAPPTSGGNNNISSSEPATTTIEAKPQLRNLSHDATKFLPAALLRNKPRLPAGQSRNLSRTVNPIPDFSRTELKFKEKPKVSSTTTTMTDAEKEPTTTKDSAYDQFMKEMQGFM